MRAGIPGLVLIRTPLDAAISWAIYQNQTLEEAVAYWNDYYETLQPYRSEIFLARFEDVTADFGGVIDDFNGRWGTEYVRFDHTQENAAHCFRVTEEEHRLANGGIREMQICRPSQKRRMVKDSVMERLDESGFLKDELARANEMYARFVNYQERSGFSPSAAFAGAEYAGLAAR